MKGKLLFISLAAIAVVSICSSLVLAEGQTRVKLCHKPGPNEVIIEVAEPAVAAHLAHGDRLGECVEGINVCPFEPITLALTDAEPVRVPLEVTPEENDVNFAAEDPPGVYWSLTYLDGTPVIDRFGADDHMHLLWEGWDGAPGFYYIAFDHPEAGTEEYPTIMVNLACGYEAPEF
jgi:hypothetical protein